MNEELRYHRVSQLLFGQPLLCTTEAAEAVGSFLRARMEGIDFGSSRFIGQEQVDPQSGRWRGYRKIGPVAVISTIGELVNRGAWMGASSGLTSYEGLVEQFRQAAADPEVKAFIHDHNSPGGEAWGMFDAAREIRALTSGRRLVAVANAVSASAAYGLASVADEIVVNEGGLVGSIGVVTVHFDQTERLKNNGVKATVIATGSKKMVGSAALPLDEEGRKLLEARAQRIMDGFVGLITQHRPQLTAEAIRAMEGDIFIGTDAVAAGLADRVGTFESVLKDLTRAAGRNSSMKGRSMTEPNSAPAAETPAGITQAQLDEAVAKATSKGREEAEASLKAERTRMAALDELAAKAGPAAADIIKAARADGSSAEATALKIFAEGKHIPAAVIAGLAADDRTAAGAVPAAPGNGPAAAAQTPEGWTAEWDGSDKLKAEYPTAAAYVATKKNEARKKGAQ